MNYYDNFDYEYLLNLYGTNVIASMTDNKGIIQFVSDAYAKISGYSKEELLGQPHNIVRHPDMPASAFKDLWKTIQSGKVWNGEVKNLKKNGQFYWVNATVTPHFDEGGNIIGYASVREDITDKKEAILLHKQIRNMLDNIEDGFLTFDKNLKVQESYSKSCLNILHEYDISGKDICSVLFKNDLEIKETFRFGCIELFKAKDMDTKEMFLSLLPKNHFNCGTKFTINYKILSDTELLVLIKDVTQQIKLEKKIEHKQKIQKMFIAIATHKEESIELIQSFMKFLDDLSEDMNQDKLKMVMHTFKGLFAQLEMIHTIEAIHNIETVIKSKKFESKLKIDLQNAFNEDIKMITDILGENFLSPITFVKVELDQIDLLMKNVKSLISKTDENEDDLYELLHNVRSMKDQSFYDMLISHEITINNVSKSVGKLMYPLEVIGDKKLLVSEDLKRFTNALVHIFRNAIVHGIEEVDIREELGKDSKGKISCSFELVSNNINLEISDDGQGIDTESIASKVLELGLLTKEEVDNLTDKDLVQFVFSNEFSTIQHVDSLAGRGVGLASVKHELSQLGGTVNIDNKPNEGLRFKFKIPYRQHFIDDSLLLSDYILESTKSFLINDIQVNYEKISRIPKISLDKYYSMINLSGDHNLLCAVSVDEKLIDKVYNVFMDGDTCDDESEIKNGLTGEIINIVFGLSLQKFPKKYNSLTLGVPIVLEPEILYTFIETNQTTMVRIETEYGNLEFAILVMSN